MFYAIRAQKIEELGRIEEHGLKFYTKANRADYLRLHPEARAVSARDAHKKQPVWGHGTTVSDESIDCVYFTGPIYA